MNLSSYCILLCLGFLMQHGCNKVFISPGVQWVNTHRVYLALSMEHSKFLSNGSSHWIILLLKRVAYIRMFWGFYYVSALHLLQPHWLAWMPLGTQAGNLLLRYWFGLGRLVSALKVHILLRETFVVALHLLSLFQRHFKTSFDIFNEKNTYIINHSNNPIGVYNWSVSLLPLFRSPLILLWKPAFSNRHFQK